MASTSQNQLARIAEATYGVTPASPAFDLMRFTSESLVPNIQYLSSDEIRPDRNVPDLTQVGGEAGGEIAGELSYGSYDKELEALLQGTWASNVLKNGITERSLTYERNIENGATDEYHRFVGSRVNSMNLRLSAKEKAMVSFGIMSKTMTTAQAAIASSTYNAANTNPIMNASTGFQNLSMTGLTGVELLSLELSITNNMAQQPVMGQLGSKGIRNGRFVVTGSFEAYFADSTILSNYLNNVATSLSFKIGGSSSLNYQWDMGNMKFSGVETPTPGNDQDVINRVNFQAIYYPTDTATLKVTRTP